VHERRTSPTVALSCWIGSGAGDDPEHLPGLAHFLEHMLLRGARGGVSPLARRTIGCGGRFDAETDREHTVFRQSVPADGWRGLLHDQAAALRSRAFRERDVERERAVILEEAASGDGEPWGFVWRRLLERIEIDRGRRHPAVGTVEGISQIGAQDLAAFRERHYVAGNVVQVVVGDVETDEVIDIAGAFGHLPSGLPARERRALPTGEFTLSRFSGPISRAYTAVGFRVPGSLHPDEPVLHAVAGLLGTGGSSRLAYALARAPGSVAHASAVVVRGMDGGLLSVRAVSRQEHVDAVASWLLREVSDLARRPPSAQELERLARRWEAERVIEHETAESVAGTIGLFEMLGGFEEAETYADRLLAVSADDVVRVTERYLNPARATAVTYGPGLPPQGAG
jgi:zinc protease